MSRRLIAAMFGTCLSACEQTLDDRLAELDDQVTVDCGYVSDCGSQAHADAVVTCLRDNLTAGIGAKAFFVLGLDPVAFVYALDGSLVNIEGYYYEGNNFTEYRCQDLQVSGTATCSYARAIGCDEIRDWY